MGAGDVVGKDSGVPLSGGYGGVAHQLLDDVGRQASGESICGEDAPEVVRGESDGGAVDADEPSGGTDFGEYPPDVAAGDRAGGSLESLARCALEEERQGFAVLAFGVAIENHRRQRGLCAVDRASDAAGDRGEDGGKFGGDDKHALAALLGRDDVQEKDLPTAGSRCSYSCTSSWVNSSISSMRPV